MSRLNLALAIGLAIAAFWAGWEWRDRSADLSVSQSQAKQAVAVVEQVQSARAIELGQAHTMANIGAKHEEDRAAAEAVPDAVVADLRTGDLRLRDDLATCTTSLLSQAVAGTIERDAHAQLRAEVAGALVQVGRDANDHVKSCQAVIVADRAVVP
jgi:hypothetical protein